MSSTKVISARIPLEQYAELLSYAKRSNMSISDYLIHLIYTEREAMIEADNHVKELTSVNEEYAENLAFYRNQIREHTETIKSLREELLSQRKDMVSLHNSFIRYFIDYFEEKAEGAILGNYKKEISTLEDNYWE